MMEQGEEMPQGETALGAGLRTSQSLPSFKRTSVRTPVQPQEQRLLAFISQEDYRKS